MVLNIITREEWGAAEPKIRRHLPIPVTNVAIQYWSPVVFNKKKFWQPCNTKEECMQRMREIQELDLISPYNHSDIHFSFMVGSDLNVYEGRGWTANVPEDSYWDGIRIGLIGRWNEDNPPPQAMLNVTFELIEFGKKRLYIKQDAYIFDMMKEKAREDDLDI